MELGQEPRKVLVEGGVVEDLEEAQVENDTSESLFYRDLEKPRASEN